jgi:hypothetical protein
MPRTKSNAALPPKSRFAEARTDVSKVFDTPADIVSASDLTEPQKVDLLRQWESDLRLLLVAAEENMTETGRGGATGERLRAVRHALATLGAAQPLDDPKAA